MGLVSQSTGTSPGHLGRADDAGAVVLVVALLVVGYELNDVVHCTSFMQNLIMTAKNALCNSCITPRVFENHCVVQLLLYVDSDYHHGNYHLVAEAVGRKLPFSRSCCGHGGLGQLPCIIQ